MHTTEVQLKYNLQQQLNNNSFVALLYTARRQKRKYLATSPPCQVRPPPSPPAFMKKLHRLCRQTILQHGNLPKLRAINTQSNKNARS